MKIALVVPHIFMHQQILPDVIFSPGKLALNLASELIDCGHKVTLFSPGPISNLLNNSQVENQTADLSWFEAELKARGDDYLDLLKKHPLTYITLARQVQAEIIAKAFNQANQGQFDVVHIWCNEEELALVNACFCQVPVVFNHHEPFNFLTRYRAIFPKYPHLNWISFSDAQRTSFEMMVAENNTEKNKVSKSEMSEKGRLSQIQSLRNLDSRAAGDVLSRQSQIQHKKQERTASANDLQPAVNWVGTVYHGLPLDQYRFNPQKNNPQPAYLLYMGRIIRPKGVHYAIQTAKQAGLKLKIAGKHYAGYGKDKYWCEFIQPQMDGEQIEYVGFVKQTKAKQQLLSQAKALIMPSTWQEPFGLVMIEALACGTPIIGFNQGAIPEIVEPGMTGWLIDYQPEAREEIRVEARDRSEQSSREEQSSKKKLLDWDQLQQDERFKANVAGMVEAVSRVSELERSACRHSFETRFTLEQMAAGYEGVYRGIIGSKRISV